MLRPSRTLHASLFLLLAGLASIAPAQTYNSPVVNESTARRHGLTRAWVSQVELDRSADHLTYVTQDRGQLLVQTKLAMVHVLDAENGRTVWARQIGRRNLLTLPPGANEDFVGIVNGTTLYIVKRPDGRREWEQRIDGAPGSGPVLNEDYVFVPMVNGMMESFEIAKPRLTPWLYRSLGRVLIQPIMTPHTISWTTNKGYFYVVDANKRLVKFRLETRDSIESQPAYWTPNVYACSTDGYVYCLNESSGKIVWKFPTGDPIVEPPVAIDDSVFVVPRSNKMYCLDSATPKVKWIAAGVSQFIARSATKVYACDPSGQLLVLDLKRGSRLDAMPLPAGTKKLINYQNDRIYLTTDTGMIQCLHEVQLKKPLLYEPPEEAAKVDRKVEIERKRSEKEKPEATADGEQPDKPEPEKPKGADEDPFGG